MGIKRLFEAPDTGIPTKVAPGLFWLRLPLPFQLDHINVWLLEENNHMVLVDTGVNTPEVTAVWDTLDAELFANKPLQRIVVTHTHPDHVGMAGPLSKKHNCPVIMSAGEYLATRVLSAELPGFDAATMMQFNAEHGLQSNQATELNQARGGLFKRLVPEPPATYLRMQEGDVLNMAGHDWVCHAGFGHSPEHIALISESLGLMISGDMLLPTISTNVSVHGSEPDGNPLKLFMRSVERMQSLPNTLTVLPSHGVPFKGIHDRCHALLRHHHRRLDELLETIQDKGALSAFEALSILFRRKMDGHQMSFAMGEAVAHLNYLWHAGKVKRVKEQGIWKYQLAK